MTFGEALAAMVTVLSAANLERTGVTYEVKVGDEFLGAEGLAPRVVVVPLSSEPAPARLQPAGATRSIAGETHRFLAELWAKAPKADATPGKDYAAASTMRATFTAAMRATFGTGFQLQDGQWSATAGESLNQYGRKFLQHFTLSVLSMDVAPTTAVVASTTLNMGQTSPGEDFVNP